MKAGERIKYPFSIFLIKPDPVIVQTDLYIFSRLLIKFKAADIDQRAFFFFIPDWKKVYAKYHKKGLSMVSVAGDRDRNDWKQALEKEQMPWVQVIDEFPRKKGSSLVAELYGIKTLPFYVLLALLTRIYQMGLFIRKFATLTVANFKQMKRRSAPKKTVFLFLLQSFCIGAMTVCGSFLGHAWRPMLIPAFAVCGGIAGIVIGAWLSIRLMHVSKANATLSAMATTAVFNIAALLGIGLLHHPGWLLVSGAAVPLTAAISTFCLEHYSDLSRARWVAVSGIFLLLPVAYFIMSSLLAFQFDHPALFVPVQRLLDAPSGRVNFNQVSPLVFMSGAVLSFFANGWIGSRRSPFMRLNINRLLLTATALIIGVLVTYQVLENLV